MAKPHSADRRTDRFCAANCVAATSKKSLPPEIREENLPARREARVNELRRQYLNGTYYPSAAEIGAALIEKHLKR